MLHGNSTLISKEVIAKAIADNDSISSAALSLKIDKRTFKKIAESYDLYYPKGAVLSKKAFKLIDILDGKHPQYPTSHLSKRLVKEGIK